MNGYKGDILYDADSCEAIRGFHDEAGTNFVSLHRTVLLLLDI